MVISDMYCDEYPLINEAGKLVLKVKFSPARQHEVLFWLKVAPHGVSAAWQQLLQ